ncbi:hypothetical protein D3C75_839560 [compost metagenome]
MLAILKKEHELAEDLGEICAVGFIDDDDVILSMVIQGAKFLHVSNAAQNETLCDFK